MTDLERPIDAVTEPPEPWVTGTPAPAQRVPGIDEAPETTYVEKARNNDLRAILIGAGIGLLVVAIVAAVALTQKSTDSSAKEAGSESIVTGSSTTSTTSSSPTTSTTAVTAATTVTTTAPVTTPSTAAPAVAPAPPPTPRATSDPAAPPYVATSLPPGVSGTLTSCAWQPTAGGQYEAAGTLTNGPSTNHGWTVTMHWLQNGREIAQQSALVDLTASQSKPWSVSLSAPNPPADPFSCALSAS